MKRFFLIILLGLMGSINAYCEVGKNISTFGNSSLAVQFGFKEKVSYPRKDYENERIHQFKTKQTPVVIEITTKKNIIISEAIMMRLDITDDSAILIALLSESTNNAIDIKEASNFIAMCFREKDMERSETIMRKYKISVIPIKQMGMTIITIKGKWKWKRLFTV